MNGRIVTIGQHHYRMREALDECGCHRCYFDLLYWVAEAV